MKLLTCFVVCIAITLSSVASPAQAATLAEQVRGRILLQVQQHGEAWYVNPTDDARYYMKDGATAYEMMRSFGLGISEADYAKVEAGNTTLLRNLKGRIILRVQLHGEAYYLHPDGGVFYLKDGPAAYALMREKSLGITDANLAQIPVKTLVPKPVPGAPATHSYESKNVVTPRGTFAVRLVTLKRSAFAMRTLTAESGDCESNCDAKSLAAYVADVGGFAGIHGSYFCPPDYPPCAGKVNTFLPPVYHSLLDILINEDTLKFYARPIIAEGEDGKLLLSHRNTDFGTSAKAWETRERTGLAAAIGNWPSLMEGGVVVVQNEPSEPAFLTKGSRGGIGWNTDNVFLVVTQNADMQDHAAVFQALGATDAMNLDGGGSISLYYDGAYKVGPGRELPNAIIFVPR